MGNLYALTGAFVQHWKVSLVSGPSTYVLWTVSQLPRVAVLGWIANRANDPVVLSYVAIGAGLMIIWNGSTNRMGRLLNIERFQGTLDLNLVSRTPLMLVLLGKALGIASFILSAGIASFLTVLVVSGKVFDVANLPLTLVSLAVALFSIVVTTFSFAPLMVLMGGQAGFFTAIIPAGVVFSGILYPVATLPTWAQIVGRFLPTSWAMDGMIHSIQGGVSGWSVVADWTTALLLTGIYFLLILLLFRKVEQRIRRTGSMVTF